jgi:hypothetical protein
MMTIWERRIGHIDSKVKPTAIGKLGLRGRLLKARVKKRRGLPSRSLPIELVLERMAIKFESQTDGLGDDGRVDRLHRVEMHERLMECKRRQLAAARQRARPSVADTRIYLWRRRREWLRRVESTSSGSDDCVLSDRGHDIGKVGQGDTPHHRPRRTL